MATDKKKKKFFRVWSNTSAGILEKHTEYFKTLLILHEIN